MSFVSKFFTALGYLFLILLPFLLTFLVLFIISVLLFHKDIISSASVFLFTLSSFSTIIFVFLLFGIISTALYLPSLYRYTMFASYIILTLLFFSLIMQQLSIIKSFSEFVSIKNRWLPCKNPSTLLEKISCFITGYMSTKTTSLLEVIIIIYGFYLYAFVIPIIVCMHLMKNFIDASGVIQNETYKNIIAFGFALLIYRFLIVAKIIDFLYIGYLGVGIIIVNLLAINYVIKKTRKMFLKIKDISEKKQKGRKIEDLKRFAKASLSRLKYIPSVNLMSVIFEDRIRNNLKTIFEAEGRLNEFEDLVAEFEDAVNRKDKNGVLLAIDKMIAAIS